MANISDDEKFQIGLPLEEEEEEKNHDENIEADIPREHEPVKRAAGDLGLQLKINIWSRSRIFRTTLSTSQKFRSDSEETQRDRHIKGEKK